ncbi:hypothetical protein [Gracilimonas sediminicola]|uniref:hypothetical protein n=1 Tax=Gracilimonas sediminicola TaxID=2952158 RepID=UPI0038D3684E
MSSKKFEARQRQKALERQQNSQDIANLNKRIKQARKQMNTHLEMRLIRKRNSIR